MRRFTGHPVLSAYGPEVYTGLHCSVDAGAADAGAGAGDGAADTKTTAVAPWAAHKGDGPWSIGDKPWFATIPEAPVAELLTAKNYKTPAELGVAYYNLNKLVSAEDSQKVLIPGKDAKPEDMDAFYTKLGRPVNPEGYNDVFKFDEKIKVDPATVDFGKKLAHKLGLNPTQAKAMADEHNAFAAKQTADMTEALRVANDTAVENIKKAWGAEADSYIEAGKRVYKSLGLDEKLVGALEAHIGAAPVVELLARIGKASGEGTFKGGGGGGDSGNPDAMTPEAAAAEITRLNGDKDFQDKYTNRQHPENKQSIERMNRLFARAGDKAPV